MSYDEEMVGAETADGTMPAPSADPPVRHSMECLTESQQGRLAGLLESYLEALEAGQPCDVNQLAVNDPDLLQPLAGYVKSLQFMHDAVQAPPLPVHNSSDSTQFRQHQACGIKQLGDYQLLRELGRGGMGVVYEAYQISLGRHVALKVLPFAAVLDSRQIARFNNEAQAAAQLHHPNIVPVYAVGCERGVHYYSMQFIDGQSLDQVLRDRKGRMASTPRPAATSADECPPLGLPPSNLRDTQGDASTLLSVRSRRYVRSVVEIMIQASEALDYAHASGIVHRDIKPSNLLLDPTGRLWVADFGLARLDTGRDLTRAGELIGTLGYMSPEQAAGQTHLVDHRSDIYALGVTLYEMLTLQAPFAGSDRQEIVRRICAEEPVVPRRHNQAIGAELENIVLKSLAKRREDRYSTAADMAKDLRCFLDGRPTIARRVTSIDRIARYMIRHKRWWPHLSATVVAGTIGLAAITTILARNNVRYQAEQEKATLHLIAAHRAVNELGIAAADQLTNIPGSEHVRESMLKQALHYYDSFTKYATERPELETDVARTLVKQASVLAQLGDLVSAQSVYTRAEAHFDKLMAKFPTDMTIRVDAALCRNNCGTLLTQLGSFPLAEQQYREAIQEYSHLLPAIPSALQNRVANELATAYFNLGRLQMQQGSIPVATESLRAAYTLLVPLADKSQDIAVQRNLASVQNALAGLPTVELVQRRHYVEAAIHIYQELNDLAPKVPGIMHEMSLSHNNLGAILRDLGDSDAAVHQFRLAITIQNQLVHAAPGAIHFKADLATTLNNLGQSEMSRSDLHEAETSLNHARNLLETLCQKSPNDVLYKSNLGGVWHNLSLLYEHRMEWDKAELALHSAMTYQQAAHDTAPQCARFVDFLNEHRMSLQRVVQTRNDRAKETASEINTAG
ncbi:MAG: serine/threonine-protein kinase [Planctomycetota bacterium]|nr:serine/threonine-protein kinase [Planctomycetota bacterium]